MSCCLLYEGTREARAFARDVLIAMNLDWLLTTIRNKTRKGVINGLDTGYFLSSISMGGRPDWASATERRVPATLSEISLFTSYFSAIKRKRNLTSSTSRLLHVPLTIHMRSVMKPSLLSHSFRSASACFRSTQRSLTTTTHPPCSRQLPIRSSFPRLQLHQAWRRSYADRISPVTKRRGRGFLRWSWRAFYLSALGGVGYMSYVIYILRTPDDQFNPDPSKKTLVILGP